MSHSANCGFTQELWPVLEWMASAVPCTQCFRWNVVQRLCESFAQLPFASIAWGVGNNPNAVSSVRGANGGSWYSVPLRIIPERGKVSENSAKPPSKQSCDVLHDDESGSYLANDASVLEPEPRSFAGEASALSRRADVLAWEPAADDVCGNSIPSKSVGTEFSDIFIDGHLRPMLAEDFAAEWLDLAERDGFKSAGPFQAQRETANSAKQVENLEHRDPLLWG